MIGHISVDRIANAICQDTTFHGMYILVEGNNDYTLFRKFFNNEICDIKISFGKDIITGVIEILEERGFSNAIAIIDSDFQNLDQTKPPSERIFFTDCHDLESSIFKSEAVDALIDQYCIKEKLDVFLNEHNTTDMRTALLSLISPLGYLKWANKQNEWGILFRPKEVNGSPLKIEDFIPVNTLKFTGDEQMVRTVLNFSRGKVKSLPKETTVIEQLCQISKGNVDHYQLCNGHDLSYLFSLALRKKVSNYNANAVTAAQIESDLILAYDSRYFEKTELYTELKHWENKNSKLLLKF